MQSAHTSASTATTSSPPLPDQTDFSAEYDYGHEDATASFEPAGWDEGESSSDEESEAASEPRVLSGGDSGSSGASSSVSTPGGRIAQYEALGGARLFHGGKGKGFIVQKTDYAGKVGSAISRFPTELLVHLFSYLDPASLLTTALTSRRFYHVASSPQVWRLAFAQYFRAQAGARIKSGEHPLSRDTRLFTRVSAYTDDGNPWRSEFIERVKLLKTYTKGRLPNPKRTQKYKESNGPIMQSYKLPPWHHDVTHMAANFGAQPTRFRVIHASLDAQSFSASDPVAGKTLLPRMSTSEHVEIQLREIQPSHSVAVDMGVNRVISISEEMGWIIGENSPGGGFYAHFDSNPYVIQGMWPHEYVHGNTQRTCVTATWMANKRHGGVYETTNKQALWMIGNSKGHMAVYTVDSLERVPIGVVVWKICPGIPIVQIKVDDEYSPKKRKERRPWIVVVNALGEVYYLRGQSAATDLSELALWKSWKQPRVPTVVHKAMFKVSEEAMNADELAEYHAKLVGMSYDAVKELWENFRMDWFVEVDWIGQNIVLGCTGTADYWSRKDIQVVDIPVRRLHLKERDVKFYAPLPDGVDFETSKVEDADDWTVTELELPLDRFTRITAMAMDNSNVARTAEIIATGVEIPGGNGRLFALGTNSGDIFIFNIRPSSTQNPAKTGPVRRIHTRSPVITTLALSSVAVFHGGIDGLVQIWDPLGSTLAPLRTLAEPPRHNMARAPPPAYVDTAHPHVAKCLLIDPDPTCLRGVVACGTMIRFWSFTLNTLFSKKMRRKRIAAYRRTDATPTRSKLEVENLIIAEQKQLQKEKEEKAKLDAEMEKRYGVARGRDALNEEEMLAYAQMISRETFEREASVPAFTVPTPPRAASPTPEAIDETLVYRQLTEEEALQEALRISLEEAKISEAAEKTPEPVVAGPSARAVVPDASFWEPVIPQETRPDWPTLQEVETERKKEEPDWPVSMSPKKKGKGKGKGKGKSESVGEEELDEEEEFKRQMELAIQASIAEAEGKGKGPDISVW